MIEKLPQKTGFQISYEKTEYIELINIAIGNITKQGVDKSKGQKNSFIMANGSNLMTLIRKPIRPELVRWKQQVN